MALNFLTTFAAIIGFANAVLSNPGSPCGTSCGNVLDRTSTDDIVCNQDDIESTAGELFSTCLDCQLQSDYSSDDGTDTDYALYNLRYASSYCVFGFPDDDQLESTICTQTQACGRFQDAIQFGNLTLDFESYEYCAIWPVNDIEHLQYCVDCLHGLRQISVANFVTALQAGCQQQPQEGVNLGLDGEIFSSVTVNITDPDPRATVNPEWFDQGPLNIGAIAGIAAGGVVVALTIAGCCIIWRGKRRRRAFLRSYEAKQGRKKGWPSPIETSTKEVSDTPLSQRPLRSWDESPASAQSEQPFPRYFSPYSSQYNSPVTGNDAVQAHENAWPALQQHLQPQAQQQNTTRNIGLALGGSESSSAIDKTSDRGEAYEMQHVDNRQAGDERNPTPGSEQESYFTQQRGRTYSGSYREFSYRGQRI